MEPELRHPEIWAPCGLLALATELYGLRRGYSLATDLYRFAWSKPPLRYGLLAFAAVTTAHLHRWPAALTRFDPFSIAGGYMVRYGREAAQQARRDLERARSA